MTLGSRRRTIQETLETEFPLIDSSLLAALISDLPSEADPSYKASSKSLHKALTELSIEAESNSPAISEGPRDHSALGSDDLPGSENSASISILDDVSPSASGASSTSTHATSAVSCSSELDFLQILFPHLSRALLTQALNECNDPQVPQDELDLSAIVDHLLTLEYIQDLEERGLEDEEEVVSGDWHTVTTRGKHHTEKPKSKSRAHKYPIPVIDIRQRQHIPRVTVTDPTFPSSSFSSDPWTRLTSLATRLSDLLQPTPPGFFMSYFHSPATQAPNDKKGWKGEGDALRNALSALASRASEPVREGAVEIVRDIVLDPEAHDAQLDAEKHSKLAADSHLCVTAAQGDTSTAIDLVWLLNELDNEFTQGGGVAHVVEDGVVPDNGKPKAGYVWNKTPPHARAPTFILATHPPPTPPPPLSSKHPPHASSSRTDRSWTLVEPRRPPPNRLTHPHAEFIPAYANRLRARSVNGGKQFGKSEKGDVRALQEHSAAWYQARAGEVQKQRNEALREAMRHWQGGNAKSRGGEVALYYAEKARELQEQQKRWTLDAARVMIEEKRANSAELDLHGLTVSEACVIVAEALAATPPTPGSPLKIITGRGRHSAGRVGVLGPAVRDMLQSARWRVGAWDGGLIVQGRM